MWKGFRWRSSESRSESSRQEHTWGLLHRLFHPHRRCRRSSILQDQEHVSGLKYQKLATQLMNDHGLLNVEAQPSVDVENSSPGIISDRTYTEALELQLKELKEYEKHKMLPIAARTMRTISIHHLECDKYVQSEAKVTESVDDKDTKCEACKLNNDNKNKHIPLEELNYLLFEQQDLFEEKLKEAKKSLLKHQNADHTRLKGENSANETKQFLDALELFHANREKFLKVLQDPQYLSTNYLQDIKSSRTVPVLSKSMSCPRVGFLGGGISTSSGMRKDMDYFVNEDAELVPAISEANKAKIDGENLPRMNQGISEIAALDRVTHEVSNTGAFHRFQDIKRRIKDLIKNENKGSHPIVLDGIQDKIPVGHPGGEEGSNVERLKRKNSFGSEWTAFAGKSSFRRSRSLSDSVDRYTHLIDQDINGELYSHTLDKFKPMHEGGVQKVSRSFGRIKSLPEYNSYYPVELAPSDSHVILPPGVTSPNLNPADASIHSWALGEKDPPGTLLIPRNEDRIAHGTDSHLTRNLSLDTLSNRISDEYNSSSEEKVTMDHFYDDKIGSGMEYTEESGETKPSSALGILDDRILRDTASFPLLEENKDPVEILPSSDVNDDSEIRSKEQHNTPSLEELDLNSLRMDVEKKHVEDFDYIMDIMKRSGFHNSELQGRWHSPELPLDSSLFKELEGISSDTEICSCVIDLNLDHLFLFDLTNEVLLEIYESYSRSQICFSNPSHICWRHEGLLFLKEVWGSIYRYFTCPHINPQTDVLDRDFDPNPWLMNMRHGVEGICTELEESILDDVVDETIDEFLNSAGLWCAAC